MEDRPAALVEMRRVLVPGGRVVVNTPGEIQPPFVAMEQAIVEHINPDLGGFVRAVFSLHDPDVLATLLHDAGLHDITVRMTTANVRASGSGRFPLQYISVTPMAPLVAAAPEAARAAMERHVVDRLQPFVVDGKTRVEQPMVVAVVLSMTRNSSTYAPGGLPIAPSDTCRSGRRSRRFAQETSSSGRALPSLGNTRLPPPSRIGSIISVSSSTSAAASCVATGSCCPIPQAAALLRAQSGDAPTRPRATAASNFHVRSAAVSVRDATYFSAAFVGRRTGRPARAGRRPAPCHVRRPNNSA